MRYLSTLLSLLFPLLFLCNGASLFGADDFPLRKKYPQVTIITTDELMKRYENCLIVDARSSVEYDICKINTATNIPVVVGGFDVKLGKLSDKDGDKTLVFYCNGHTCSKSYKAWIAADKAGFKNILCYDGGIFDWITAAHERATLLGETPADQGKVIPKPTFYESCLEKEAFLTAASKKGTLVFDIREPLQRSEYEGVAKSRNVPFTRFVGMLKAGKFKGKNILIYDSVGKQVRWLEYRLVENGYTQYKFLKGGARALKPKKAE